MAEESCQKLSSYITSTKDTAIQFVSKGKFSDPICIPSAALNLLVMILSEMSKGNAVTIMPIHSELTTQQAADILNVSRPFLIKLLEEGAIPFRKVGTRRHILAKDVLQYKHDINKKRSDILDILANEAQKNNMGY